MKFAKHMASKAVPAWKLYYLDYKRLKKILERISSYCDSLENGRNEVMIEENAGMTLENLKEVEDLFQEGFKEEVDKVEYFTYSKLKQCKSMFQQLTLQFFELKYPTNHHIGSLDQSSKHLSDTRVFSIDNTNPLPHTNSMSIQAGDVVFEASTKLSASLHSLINVLKHLSNNFIPLNKLAVYKIYKKHDKVCNRLLSMKPDGLHENQLALGQELLKTAKTERRFYFRYKEDVVALMEEAQHMQHEINRLSIRKRQQGV
ncbi:hypothetical protein K502DRAFT_324478, partial [Neoconidiobolus thromboides FSU 785]